MYLRVLRLLICSGLPIFILAGCMGHDMAGMSAADHSKHQAMMNKKGYASSVETYQIPDLVLTDHDGQRVSINKILDSDKPVVVNFIYATCTTICPLLSMGFIDLQRELGDKSNEVLLVSITIDPEHDTPEVLTSYRNKYKGQPGWVLLTGSRLDIDNITTAFDAFFGDKMDHQPLNFIRLPEQNKWIRINGMVNGKDYLHEMEMAGIR